MIQWVEESDPGYSIIQHTVEVGKDFAPAGTQTFPEQKSPVSFLLHIMNRNACVRCLMESTRGGGEGGLPQSFFCRYLVGGHTFTRGN